ncbi:alpha/beta fold hydrolase [Streptomyces sp. BI20]|uniref:alpha/beta fold hydrolase n=1 Tax=Streptomyces sp. BI20 TaxID=3403460 RepID=UPI003C76D810
MDSFGDVPAPSSVPLPDALDPYPASPAYDGGFLDVGDGQRVAWECSGNPAGVPLLVVHGGPGSGGGVGAPARPGPCDPARYRVIRFDQRGCGLSTPHASDPGTDLSVNTTGRLVADMERLREETGVRRWVLFGGSWGSTLILAYAVRYPERVRAIVLHGVTTTRRSEIDWLYRGVARFRPEAWERFVAASGPAGAAAVAAGGHPVAAYAALVSDPDPRVRERAVRAWCAWEDAVLAEETEAGGGVAPTVYTDRAVRDRAAFVRICAHYFAHGAWLEEGELLRDAGRLAGVPGVLTQGRRDLAGPPDTAWALARAWPGAELRMVEGGGHLATEESRRWVRAALDRFAEAP